MPSSDTQSLRESSHPPMSPPRAATVLVTGASGLLGTALVAALARAGCRVVPQTRTRAPGRVAAFDLEDLPRIEQVVRDCQPDWIVHAAGNTNIDACEADPVAAGRLHVGSSAALARAAACHGSRLVYVSTDSVYDGEQSGAHVETDEPSPLNHYARTKRDGEQACLDELPCTIVARVNFFGLHPVRPTGLAAWLTACLREGRPVNGFADVHFNPLLNGDLADLLAEVLDRDLPGGLYNFGASDCCSKYEFACRVAQRLGADPALVRPVPLASAGLRTRRPRNTVMDVRKLSAALGHDLPTIEAGLDRLFPVT